jgi:apolipoprotein N-acyltransferase
MNKKAKKATIHKKSSFDFLRKTPNWLIASILYGLSWCMLFNTNLAFLAWFAFVPLFFSLEEKRSFWEFYKTSLFFFLVAIPIICHGFLITPKEQGSVFIAAVIEIIMSTGSFALLYPVQKKFGFSRSLVAFPFIIALWEWFYQWLDFTFGYVMLSHSQTQNTWLIQYIDLFGVWSIASWVMGFNVLIYLQLKRFKGQYFDMPFIKQMVFICLIMVVPPLIYANIRYNNIESQPKRQINITLINTDFSLNINTYELYIKKLERLTHITDSTDYELNQRRQKTDLYVWHEGAVDFGNDQTFYNFIDSAVNDWKTPLLTGMQIIPADAGKIDRRRVNRAALIQKGSNEDNFLFYDKVHLAPGREKIPYHQFLALLPGFPVAINDSRWFKSGYKVSLINLQTRNKQNIKIGTPICMEQNYPVIWSDMAMAGAECFVQLSFEAWWSMGYFKKQMANITRLRCIETRRYAARCSNGGSTQFTNAFGEITALATNREGSLSDDVKLYQKVSFFSEHQWVYPFFCFIFIVTYFFVSVLPKISSLNQDISN